MQELNGFIKLFRKFKKWRWYDDPIVKAVFLELLLSATYKNAEWQGENLSSGELITSYASLSKKLGISIQQARTALKKLQSTKEITIKSTNKYTIITVNKWGEYQDYEGVSNKQSTNHQQSTNNQATINQQHLKNIKNIENKKKAPFESAWPNVQNLADLCRQMR